MWKPSGILLLYHHPIEASAATIMEHVNAFVRHSRHRVDAVNTEFGLPEVIASRQYPVVVMHYSIFGTTPYQLNPALREYLHRVRDGSYFVTFFQDEYHHCSTRFAFLDEYAIDCVFTLVEPQYWDAVYGRLRKRPHFEHTLTGYVSPDLEAHAAQFAKPYDARTIDVGYRGRTLAYYMGEGAQEKVKIAKEFLRRTRGLRTDIAWDEDSRHYGNAWYEFLGNSRAVLGVEAGVSIFDLEGEAEAATKRLLAAEPDLSFEQVRERVLGPYEGNIPYRTVSPRHFEAAAFRALQVLHPGHYSGVMEANVHYIPLEKDFSNLDEVLRRMSDRAERDRITDAAHRDLIASGNYSYPAFISHFDDVLRSQGVTVKPRSRLKYNPVPRAAARHAREATRIRLGIPTRTATVVAWFQKQWDDAAKWMQEMRYAEFPGRRALKWAFRRLFPL